MSPLADKSLSPVTTTMAALVVWEGREAFAVGMAARLLTLHLAPMEMDQAAAWELVPRWRMGLAEVVALDSFKMGPPAEL
jgi:hypothetical protein